VEIPVVSGMGRRRRGLDADVVRAGLVHAVWFMPT
jgi:hypothetical protein